jgi:hypothetical protein
MRRYGKTPYFSTQQMADSPQLEDAGNVIEGAMCGFDFAHDRRLKDGFYKNVTKRLLDRYAFGDQAPSFSDDLEEEGFSFIESAINDDLPEATPEFIAKVIGTVYRSIKRHANGDYGDRKYIDFVHAYVGIRMAKGAPAL